MFAVVATPDLMLASRFTTAAPAVRTVRDEARAVAAVKDPSCLLVLVDLEKLPELAPRLRAVILESGSSTRLVGFAPHVLDELLAEAENWCDSTLARGAAISRFPKLLEDAGIPTYNQQASSSQRKPETT